MAVVAAGVGRCVANLAPSVRALAKASDRSGTTRESNGCACGRSPRNVHWPKYPVLSQVVHNVTHMATHIDTAGDELSEKDRRVLDFEGSWWLYPQPKDRAIPEYIGMSATRYYQALRRLMDDDAALAYAPMTVLRLRRMRRDRSAQIAARVRGRDGAS